jgi:HPt (histidine-containing phosphotransfer) domain-containing protein
MTDTDLDEAILDGMCDGDREFESELLETFVGCQEAAMSDLNNALDRGDFQELKKLAHFTKGGARSIGATRLAGIAEQLEVSSAKSDQTTVEKLVAEAQSAYIQLKIVIENRVTN